MFLICGKGRVIPKVLIILANELHPGNPIRQTLTLMCLPLSLIMKPVPLALESHCCCLLFLFLSVSSVQVQATLPCLFGLVQ